MKNNREVRFFIIFFTFLFFIFLNFGIHAVRTIKFNQRTHVLNGDEARDGCSFNIHFRGGAADSWLKRDVQVADQIKTLKGSTFDGVFTNESECEIVEWKVRIDIGSKCYLNNAWCGTVDVHQNGKSQILDLRNIDAKSVILDGLYVGQDYMIPLDKGDYIIYLPSVENDELPIRAFNGAPGTVTIGSILYADVNDEFSIEDYVTEYRFHKGLFQGTESKIFLVLMTLWIVVLLVKISFRMAYKKAETMQQKLVVGLANLIDNRSSETGGHVKRTSDVIKIIVEEFRDQNPDALSDEMARGIIRAAPLHDLGKLYIDDSILYKPGKFTEEEFALVKKHAEFSGDIVNTLFKEIVEEPRFVEVAFNVARHHHERWDGRGYPDKLAGEAIPLEARLMSIADVYDALVSKRCYKEPMSFEKAFEVMCEGMGSQFDPQMKSVFIACHEKLEAYYKKNGR